MTQADSGATGSERRNRGVRVAIIVGVVAIVAVGAFLLLFRPTAVVPDLALKTDVETQALLDAAGLRAGEVTEVATDTVGLGRVVDQDPAAGTKVPRNTKVDISVSVASAPAVMPNVTLLTAEAATTQLEAAQFVVRTVDVLETDDEPGTVIGQVPAAGTEWMTGRPVAIAVAAGPDDGTGVEIPDVYGDSLDTAIGTLAEQALLGYAIVPDPSDVEGSEVGDQLPDAGNIVRQGTTVLLLLEPR